MSVDMKNYTGDLDSAAESQNNSTPEPQQDLENVFDPSREIQQALVDVPVASPEPSAQELNFKALREEVDRIKQERVAEKEDYQNQIALLRSNINQPRNEPSKPKGMFEDLGLKENDVPNVREIEQAWGRKEAEYQSRIEELSVAQQHSDYGEVLEKHLSPLIKQKPHLAGIINSAPNKALAAYELGKMYQQSQSNQAATSQALLSAEQARPIHPNAERILANAARPGSLSSVGGQGALSQTDYYQNMSDKDFAALAEKNLSMI